MDEFGNMTEDMVAASDAAIEADCACNGGDTEYCAYCEPKAA